MINSLTEEEQLEINSLIKDVQEGSKNDLWFEWPARDVRKSLRSLLKLPIEEAKELVERCFPEGYDK